MTADETLRRPADPNDVPPVRVPRPVAGLGLATQIVIGVALLVNLAQLPAVLNERRSGHRFADTLTLEALNAFDHDHHNVFIMTVTYLFAFAAAGIVMIVWLWRARTNADAYGTVQQRRRIGWVIGGWFVPFVSFRFPYQITTDVMRASEPPEVPGQRIVAAPPAMRNYGLIRAWWSTFLVSWALVYIESRLWDSDSLDSMLTSVDLAVAGIFVELAAGILAILVVRRVTAAQVTRAAEAGRPG